MFPTPKPSRYREEMHLTFLLRSVISARPTQRNQMRSRGRRGKRALRRLQFNFARGRGDSCGDSCGTGVKRSR